MCSVFCGIANYITINSINRLNLIGFLVRAERVISKIEIMCLYVIQTNVSLQNVRITKVFSYSLCAYLPYILESNPH